MKPFFSIILPTFNQANFLKICIKSVLDQTFRGWELLIIDNNSTDNTHQIIKSFKDKRIKIYRINNKGLLAKSRNLGIKKSKARWICFIDSDDKWRPQKLKQVKKFIDYEDGDLFYHDLVFENKKFLFRKKILDKSNTIKKPILKYFTENGNPIGQSSVVIRKSILKKINYISENKEKFSWEDFDTWIRVSKITDKFIRVPEVLGSIWIGPENISNLERQILNTERIKKYYFKTFNKFLSQEEKKKNLWWLEYPSIFKDYKEKNIISLRNRINKISNAPFKFSLIFFYMKNKLSFLKIFRKIRQIITIIIFFRNKKKLEKININNKCYKKIDSLKNLKKLKFDNFKISNEFFERIKNKNELHFIHQNKKMITYGWSSKRKRFLISEVNCEIKNNKNTIFFDFYTLKNFRNQGFYKLLLNRMLIKYKLNNCYIYTTLSNIKSIRAIVKSNFKYVNFFTSFKKKINLA